MTISVLVAVLIVTSSLQKSSHHLTNAVKQLENQRSVKLESLLKSRKLWTSQELSSNITTNSSSSGSDSMDITQCFKKGICQDGHFLNYEKTENLSHCMANCALNDECQWSSYDTDFSYCTLFSNCPQINGHQEHSKSMSSRSDCPLEVPCNVTGRCEGPIRKFHISSHQCHAHCEQDPDCNWYSFGENVCILFSTCVTVDVSLASFTTQHSTCPELALVDEMKSYTEKYDTIRIDLIRQDTATWKKYLFKTITRTHEDPRLNTECGLYCEEAKLCDFFAQRVPVSRHCYLGTFRQHLTHSIDSPKRLYGSVEVSVSLVDKSKYMYLCHMCKK